MGETMGRRRLSKPAGTLPAMLELLTPVRLTDGRTGETVGRTLPTLASEARYDVRIGREVVANIPARDVTAVGPCNQAALNAAQALGREAFGEAAGLADYEAEGRVAA